MSERGLTQRGGPRARPRSLDNPRWPECLEALRGGGFWEPTCWAHGIDPRAVEAALQHDPDARADVAEARAEGVRLRLAHLDASDDWKREAWLLERLAPKVFHLPTKVTGVTPEDGGAPIVTRTLSEAEARAELVAIDAEVTRRLASGEP